MSTILLAMVWLSAGQMADGGVQLSGRAETTSPWCAGARPPPEREGLFTTHLKRERLVLKPGKLNSKALAVAEFVTDDQGRFTVTVPPGAWCVVPASRPPVPPEEEAADPKKPRTAAEVQCLQRLWTPCLATFEVSGVERAEVVVRRQLSCNSERPCGPEGPEEPPDRPSRSR